MCRKEYQSYSEWKLGTPQGRSCGLHNNCFPATEHREPQPETTLRSWVAASHPKPLGLRRSLHSQADSSRERELNRVPSGDLWWFSRQKSIQKIKPWFCFIRVEKVYYKIIHKTVEKPLHLQQFTSELSVSCERTQLMQLVLWSLSSLRLFRGDSQSYKFCCVGLTNQFDNNWKLVSEFDRSFLTPTFSPLVWFRGKNVSAV